VARVSDAGPPSELARRTLAVGLRKPSPVCVPVRPQIGLEGSLGGEMLVIAKELQAAGVMRLYQYSQDAPAEQGETAGLEGQ
jgi:hypothetical protein